MPFDVRTVRLIWQSVELHTALCPCCAILEILVEKAGRMYNSLLVAHLDRATVLIRGAINI